MVMTFFPDSASTEALSAIADVTGFDFDKTVERLTDLSLLDIQQIDLMSTPRYVLHPLVRAFAYTKLTEQHEFEQDARERWSRFLLDFATSQARLLNLNERYWDSLATTQSVYQLDAEWTNLLNILEWADKNMNHHLLVELMMCLIHQMDRRGAFVERTYYVQKAIEASLTLGQHRDAALFQIDGLGWTLVEEGRFNEAEQAVLSGLEHMQALDADSVDRNKNYSDPRFS